MTREELRNYVDEQRMLRNIPYHVYSTLIDGIDTLEQESFINKPCVSSGVCEYDKNKVLDKIRAEIEKPLHDERCFDTANAKAQYIALNWCIEIIDKYRKEQE